ASGWSPAGLNRVTSSNCDITTSGNCGPAGTPIVTFRLPASSGDWYLYGVSGAPRTKFRQILAESALPRVSILSGKPPPPFATKAQDGYNPARLPAALCMKRGRRITHPLL